MNQKYTISLDIGTNSVGWAVLRNFSLAKKHKKIIEIDGEARRKFKQSTNLWGAYVFEEAETALGRRVKRTMRRRILRRRNRITNLQKIFENEIAKIDPDFFHRLDEGFLQNEDRTKGTKQEMPLFGGFLSSDGESYSSEKDYYKTYPTIYHLRMRLMNDASKADIRLVYLALHHILKHRGHFVNQGQVFDLSNLDITETWVALLSLYNQDDITSFNFAFDDSDKADKANKILKDRNLSKSKKVFKLCELYNSLNIDQNFEIYEQGTDKKTKDFLESKNKQQKALFAAAVGNGIDLAMIFENPSYNNKENENMPKSGDFKYGLDAEKYEEKLATIKQYLTDGEMQVIECGKDVYESIVLCNILTQESLSASMIKKFEQHKDQLKTFKQYVHQNYSREVYLKIFGTFGIYSRYVKHGTLEKSLTRDEFYAELKKLVPQYVEREEIASEMECDRFLPKQRVIDNGSIPYQIHKYELMKIIENQSKHYQFLANETDRLQKLIEFRIPYYVGPLTSAERSKFAWMQKRTGMEGANITPWNFDEVVDRENSNTQFIERMTSFCTYLPHEKVLPDSSLTYQEFKVYNELIICGYEKGEKEKVWFSPKLRQRIVDELFKKHKKVTGKHMVKFLYNNGITSSELSVSQLFGIDTIGKSPGYNTSYSTYIDLIESVGLCDSFIEKNKPVLEQIIKWATIFKDRKILQQTITRANKSEWNGLFTHEQISKLSKLRYTGWGRLSAKLLTGIRCGNGKSILSNLKEEQFNNFMRLLRDEKVKEAVKEAQLSGKEGGTLNYSLVEELAGSPAIKKGIGQSLKIIKELENVLKLENIDKIVIEMARGDGTKGKRTVSRRKQIEKMYQNFTKNTDEVIPKEIRENFDSKANEKEFDNERLFLYFLQNGKCMYTKETLEISNLSDYDVDHIIPQAYIKDDSLDNKVLGVLSK
ncbi:MAG: type II CRISPR RNA-guided endonuclease Cas9 [Defluviitaleaceae bacterium]|nr:type II CRISPR RNA-guided endonuclease Cas9 [Defluviitaleaceae bacterium]